MEKEELNKIIDNIFLKIIDNLNNEKENLLNSLNTNNLTTNYNEKILEKKILDGNIYYIDKNNNLKYDVNGTLIKN